MKIATRFTLMLIVVLVLTFSSVGFAPVQHVVAQAPQPADTSALPVWLNMLIVAGATWLVTNGLKSLSKALPWTPDLSGYGTAIASALSNGVILFLSGVLATLPVQYQDPVGYSLAFAGTLLAAFGIHFTVKSFQPQAVTANTSSTAYSLPTPQA